MSQRAALTLRSSKRQLARPERLAWVVLAALACVLAHEATYLLSYGAGTTYAATMTQTGHDGYWLALLLAVTVATVGLALVAIRHLRRLHREAASAPTLSDGDGIGGYLSLAVGSWARLALAAGLLYTAQENAEALLAGAPVQGLDVVLRHGALPLLMILLATLVVALVAALVHWRRLVLLGRIAVPVHDWDPAAALAHPRFDAALPGRSHIPGSQGSRAPPRPGFRPSAVFQVDLGR